VNGIQQGTGNYTLVSYPRSYTVTFKVTGRQNFDGYSARPVAISLWKNGPPTGRILIITMPEISRPYLRTSRQPVNFLLLLGKATNAAGTAGFQQRGFGFSTGANLAPPSELTAFQITTPGVIGMVAIGKITPAMRPVLRFKRATTRLTFQPTSTLPSQLIQFGPMSRNLSRTHIIAIG